jgi:hypothetical protein
VAATAKEGQGALFVQSKRLCKARFFTTSSELTRR